MLPHQAGACETFAPPTPAPMASGKWKRLGHPGLFHPLTTLPARLPAAALTPVGAASELGLRPGFIDRQATPAELGLVDHFCISHRNRPFACGGHDGIREHA